MCGILGILTPPDCDLSLSQHDVLAMRDSMATRGLAGSSFVQRKNLILATRNHPSATAFKLEKPAFSSNDRFALVADVDLWQLDSLLDELRRSGFHCASDSGNEVLLSAWLAWGKSFVRKLQGSFAIAVTDLAENRCWLIRDRCGAKPLFYSQIGQSFVFASSIKSIRRHPEFSSQPNLATIRHYLATLRLTLNEQTLIKNLQTVLPAEIVCFQAGKIERHSYWSADQPIDRRVRFADSVEELTEQLREVIRQSVSDMSETGRSGIWLDGTLDSSLLSCMAAGTSPHSLVSRCCGISQSDGDSPHGEIKFHSETRFAREMKFSHRSFSVSPDRFLETWQHLVDELAAPLMSPNEVLLYQLARSMKCEATSLLVADGANELFCGYNVPHWAGHDFENARTFSQVRSSEADQTRESLRKQYGRDQFYSPADHFLTATGLIPRNSVNSMMREKYWDESDDERSLERYYDNLYAEQGERPMPEKWAQVLFRVNLESVLMRTDRVTAQAGIQVRSPFTDRRLLEFAFRLPHHYKIDLEPSETKPWLSSMELDQRQSIRSKRILRSAAQSLISANYLNAAPQSTVATLSTSLATDWRPWAMQTLRESRFFNEVFHESTIDELANLPTSLGLWNWPLVNLALWGEQVF